MLGGDTAGADLMSNVESVITTTTNKVVVSANSAVSIGRWSNLAIIALSPFIYFPKAAKTLLLLLLRLRLRGFSVHSGLLGQSFTPSPAFESSLRAVGGVLVFLVAGRERDPGGWPWSRRRAGSRPAPSRGDLSARNKRSILPSEVRGYHSNAPFFTSSK